MFEAFERSFGGFERSFEGFERSFGAFEYTFHRTVERNAVHFNGEVKGIEKGCNVYASP